jgi:dolichol-phosphate mannosyltransferase
MVVVDDASDDGTAEVLRSLMRTEPRLRALRLAARVGQSGALAAGFAHARGEVVITLDADLQNDPADAPRLVAALGAADVACGVRRRRQDRRGKRWSSLVANAVRRRLLDDDAVDTGCGLKAFRAEALRLLPRFDGWHRFFPALARREGLRVASVDVSHRPRRHGRSKYGTLDRLARGVVDLLGVMWLGRRRLAGARVVVELDAERAAERERPS